MAEDGRETTEGGQARLGDRRGTDRRRVDRRAPVPPWRRPWAFASYGAVAAAVVVVLALRGCGGGSSEAANQASSPIRPAPPPIDTARTVARAPGGVEQATSTADFDRLTLEGARARGRVVVAQLYCDPPGTVPVVGTDSVVADVAVLVDSASSRVPAARCKWGAQDDPRRSDFLLLVPPPLAGDFAAQPVVQDGTVRRRKVIGTVEWIGTSRPLELETVGIYRGVGVVR